MLTGGVRRLAVLGSPVAHSKSPALHAAAYAALGLPWRYEAVELEASGLASFVASRDAEWRGLSLTMPHKHVVLPLLDERDATTELVGAANTLLFDAGRRRGFNTDVEGIERAFADHGVTALASVAILGAGATAQSALVATARLGAGRALVLARDPGRAERALAPLAERLGVALDHRRLDDAVDDEAPDAVVATLPGGTGAAPRLPAAWHAASVLFDVAYEPWPSVLAARWGRAGGRVVSGLEMLLHQAVAQVRVFASGRVDRPLEREDEVGAAMRASVGL